MVRILCLPYASPPGAMNGGIFPLPGSDIRIVPNCDSYFMMFSCKANIRRLACSAVSRMRAFTGALGTPGIMCMKSMINSEGACEMIARLE